MGTLTSLQVVPGSEGITVGQAKRVKALAIFAGNPTPIQFSPVTWSSNYTSVATIDATGKATCLAGGRATLSATDPSSGITSTATGGNCVLSCLVPQLVQIFPRPSSSSTALTGTVGTTTQLRARVTYVGGQTQGVNAVVHWSSSDDAIVTVSNGSDGNKAGFTTFVSPGMATITITYPATPASPALTDSVLFQVK